MSLPKMVEVRQKISSPKIDDFVFKIREELRWAGLHEKVKPGMRIAMIMIKLSASLMPRVQLHLSALPSTGNWK